MSEKKSHKTNTSATLFLLVIHGFEVSWFFFVGYIDVVTSGEKEIKEQQIEKQKKKRGFLE